MNGISNPALYLITFMVALCSLVYELLIAQTISFFASNSVIWYSLTIGLYLVSLGAGAYCADRFIGKNNLIASFIKLEILLSLIGGMVVLIIHYAQMLMVFGWVRNWEMMALAVFYLSALGCVLSVGFLTGIELPLLIKLGEKSNAKNVMNRVLSADYFGSLAGGLIFPLYFFPRFQLISIGWMVALMNLGSAFMVLIIFQKEHMRKLWLFGMSVTLIFMLCLWYGKNIQQYFLNKFYYYDFSVDNLKSLLMPTQVDLTAKRENSTYQKIDLVQLPVEEPLNLLVRAYSTKLNQPADFPQGWALFMDGYFQLWADFEELYHEYFAHMPIQLNGNVPENVLVLGAGDGCLLRELVKYPTIKHIKLVEIDPKVIELAKHNHVLKTINQNAFEDPRVEVITTDAYHYVKNSKEQFDAVYMDFPAPKDYNLSKIFSLEFYTFVYRRLADHGFAVMDAPRMRFSADKNFQMEGLSPETFIYLQTLTEAGFHQIWRYSSKLETDNGEAQKIFSKLIGDHDQLIVHEKDARGEYARTVTGKKAIAERMIEDFTGDYKEEFLMISKVPKTVERQFKDYNINLHVLNQKRFELSLAGMADEKLQSVDQRYVNSIMRPTLPRIDDWWQVKIPH